MEMFILGMIVGVALAWFVVRWLVEHALARAQRELGTKSLDQLIEHMEQQLAQPNDTDHALKLPVTVEQHNNIYMIYESKTSQFLAQGQDYWEVMNRLEKIYPNQLFEVVGGDAVAIKSFMSTSDEPRAT
jgi:hypothetical protein